MRTITIVSTRNSNVSKVETSATTWGELKSEISGDYDLSQLTAVENINRTTLERDDATLPAGDFRIFLRPTKTKAGYSNYSFKELRQELKDNDKLKEVANNFAKESGRNWTQLNTEELRSIVSKFFGKTSETSVEEVSPEKKVITKASLIAKFESFKEDVKSLMNDYLFDEEDEKYIEDHLDIASDSIDNIFEVLDEYIADDLTSDDDSADSSELSDIQREMREMGL